MNFIAPQNLAFGALLGVVLLLYVLRMKRRERVVSSTLLWQTALRDLQANTPWQKLRSSLLMWLQLLFLLLLVLALARPAIKVLASRGQSIAIILDASASMAATDVSPSRFERARGEALRLVNSLSSGDAATIIAAGAQTRVLSPLSRDKNVLKRALASARTQDSSCNLRDAAVLAATLLRPAKNRGGAQIYLLSDGAVPPLPDETATGVGMQFIKIGTRNENLAITAMDARRAFSAGSTPQIFVTLHNFSTQARSVNLELSHDGNLIAVRPVTVPAAQIAADKIHTPGVRSELFDDLAFESGLFGVRFETDDDLLADNAAYARLEAPHDLQVLYIGNNGFLERALQLLPRAKIVKADANELPSAKNSRFDVIVCEGVAPANLPLGNQLIFNAVTALSPVEKIGVAARPSVADWDRRHPATRFAPWNDVQFAQSLAVRLRSWGRAIVEAERTPLIVAGERDGQRVIWCGFDLRDTDLPLRVAFPIFITSSLQWLTAPRRRAGADTSPVNAEGAALRVGAPISLNVPPGVPEISVTLPDKTKDRVPVQNGVALFQNAMRVGIYSARATGNSPWQQAFGVSLLDKNESDLQPRDSIAVSGQTALAGETRARSNRELWGLLAIAALALLSAEWWIYHRGV